MADPLLELRFLVQAGWADLPAELLTAVVAAAHLALCPAGAVRAAAVPCRQHLPSLAQVAQLCSAIEACCRSWRTASAEGPPVQVAVGSSPLPADAARVLTRWVRRHPLAALHFEATPRLPGCRSGEVQHLAVELLASEELLLASGMYGVPAVLPVACWPAGSPCLSEAPPVYSTLSMSAVELCF